jgi:cystathionine gamma-lyase
MRRFKGSSTTAVHSGEPHDRIGPVNTPIVQSSTFYFPTQDRRTWEGEVPPGSFIYSRYGNPTVEVVERKLAELESGKQALLFASGMAAITTAMLTYVRSGERIVSQEDVYGGSYNLMRNHLAPLGIDVEFVPSTDTEALVQAITPRTKLVWLESPTNPLLKMVDYPEVVKAAHEEGALAAIDNTFATPINQRPLECGADLVMESGTKYLGGHSDLLAGAIVSDNVDLEPVMRKRVALGGTMDPFAAYLLERGMKTLAVRMRCHNHNAQEVAEFLQDHPRVERVHYPGLKDHPQHSLARKLMSGFGGMLSFEVKGGREGAERTMSSTRVIKMATSLGGVESLVSMPLNSSHHALPAKERERLGIRDSLLRLSVGIEDPVDLIEDLDLALRSN